MSLETEISTVVGFIADIETAGIAGDAVTLVKLIANFIESSNGTPSAAQLAVLKSYDGTKTAADYLAAAQQAATATQPASPPAA